MNSVARVSIAYLAAAVVLVVPASAAVVTGTTLREPTYNRLATLTSTSRVGTAVSYQSQRFTVSSAGSYSLLLTGTGFDTFLTLYLGNFSATAPLIDAVALNDDLAEGDLNQSGLVQALTAETSYFAVVTGFGNGDAGAYTLSITGPGMVTFGTTPAVPEPAGWTMMIVGMGMIGFAMRCRPDGRTLPNSAEHFS